MRELYVRIPEFYNSLLGRVLMERALGPAPSRKEASRHIRVTIPRAK
jgi:hypothetical protein